MKLAFYWRGDVKAREVAGPVAETFKRAVLPCVDGKDSALQGLIFDCDEFNSEATSLVRQVLEFFEKDFKLRPEVWIDGTSLLYYAGILTVRNAKLEAEVKVSVETLQKIQGKLFNRPSVIYAVLGRLKEAIKKQ